MTTQRRIAGLAATLAGLAALARPALLTWGASAQEVRGPWPGDELTPHPSTQATRALTIHAAPAEIWPWIVQIGQDRAGFYSFAVLENLIGARMPTIERIVPVYQHRAVGDRVWMATPERYGGTAFMTVGRLDPERAMVLVAPDDFRADPTQAPNGSWAFLLDPRPDGTTRLIMRSRGPERRSALETLAALAFWDPTHALMELRMMVRIRELVEDRGAALRAAAAFF